LPVRILLPAADSDVFKVLGEGNTEGAALTTAGEGILNTAGGAVEANERFRGALIEEDARRERVAAMRAKADAAGFHRRPVVFEGNAPIPAEDTPPAQFVDEIRGADARTLRLRFGAPVAIAGSADINLRRESGANVLLVARDAPIDVGTFGAFSLPKAVTANIVLSAVARGASVEVVDFLPADEGLESLVAPLADASVINLSRRRQVPGLLQRIAEDVKRRIDDDDTSSAAVLLVLSGMHRARDFDQDSVDYDAEVDLPELLGQILRDGPEIGVHTFMWFETLAGISRRLPSSATREVSWRLAGKMSADDSSSLIGVDAASSLREQQLIAANDDRGVLQRCTTIAEPPPSWIQDLLAQAVPKEPIQ
jgi:S-DNA-T family DNA segregation ATPase FtsK/SpoIIIE